MLFESFHIHKIAASCLTSGLTTGEATSPHTGKYTSQSFPLHTSDVFWCPLWFARKLLLDDESLFQQFVEFTTVPPFDTLQIVVVSFCYGVSMDTRRKYCKLLLMLLYRVWMDTRGNIVLSNTLLLYSQDMVIRFTVI